MASGKKRSDWRWPLIIFLFFIGAAPLAVLLLVFTLFGDDEEEKQPKKPTTAKRKKPLVVKKTQWRKILGGILAFLGLFMCVEPIESMLWLQQIKSYYVEDLLVALAFLVGGSVLLGRGILMDRRQKRFAKYLSVMGDREAIPVQELARTLGYSQRRVEQDLHKMIDKGYFGGQAYVNVELGCLFRSGSAGAEYHRQQEEQAKRAREQAAAEAEGEYAKVLRDIRQANDRIADPVLSAKIDRLEEITARIFKIVEEDPKKKNRIDRFLNYYLPTTQKLLDSYAEFEAAGVEGENLRQAKSRIESTMDSIVRGFEHQLDQLYKTDAMDVDSDIRVMEQMLRRDTASADRDFDLGGTAVQQAEEQ
ncbi:MAG: 5-bromo-4-chloroindolyl phosphate hydrolysis family protein [Oscillibacter sp.]|nr:5-bromo-4-chloroindolyl phosphate hydrolysis family protein [Oscillibacter sp.]